MKMTFSNTVKITLLALLIAACGTPEKKSKLLLPVFGKKMVVNNDTVYHTIKNFSLINQWGDSVNKQTVKNKIYVANFFFTTCKSICPEMSTNLVDVQKAFLKDDSVLILSHSVNPDYDTVQVLQSYSFIYKTVQNKWHLLTGNKKQIYSLAKESYLVNALEDDGSREGFIHSELFLLIDTKSRIRGMYDGTDKGQVQKLISDIRLLKRERD